MVRKKKVSTNVKVLKPWWLWHTRTKTDGTRCGKSLLVAMMFGPSDEHSPNSAQSMASNALVTMNYVKSLSITPYLATWLGSTGPRFKVQWRNYEFGEIDWHEFNEVIAGHVITSVSKHAVKHGKKAKWCSSSLCEKTTAWSEQSEDLWKNLRKSKWKIKTIGRSICT